MNDRRIQFVLDHYKEGMKSTADALKSVYAKAGIVNTAASSFMHYFRYAVPAFALAVILLVVVVSAGARHNAWTEYRAESVKAIVPLSDGSVITLAPGSMIRIQQKKNPRHVELDGDAYFEVSRDENNPFTVSAGTATIRVLGTKFQVRASNDATGIDVTEGKVLFAASGREDGLVLTRGMSASLRKGCGMPEPDALGRLNPAAWATGWFVYEQEELGNALEELSSYYGVNLCVELEYDSALSLTGKFSTESLDDILYAIESALGVDIIQQ